MAWTIIEAQRQTGIASTKIRFWIKKGLFPYLQTDKNGVRYFSVTDIESLKWIEYLRKTKMPISDIKTYILAYHQGDSTIKMRKEIVQKHYEFLKKDIEKMQEILKVLKYKCEFYENLECAKRK